MDQLVGGLLKPYEISWANPVVYLLSAFRWSFYQIADVSVGTSVAATLGFPCLVSERGVVDLQDPIPAQDVRPWISPRQRRPPLFDWDVLNAD